MRRRLIRGALAAAVMLSCFMAGFAVAQEQVHMENALGALQRALGELQQAESNKGGHRERAIDLVQRAIDQVQQGIQWSAGSDE
jgi:hypothetical protein